MRCSSFKESNSLRKAARSPGVNGVPLLFIKLRGMSNGPITDRGAGTEYYLTYNDLRVLQGWKPTQTDNLVGAVGVEVSPGKFRCGGFVIRPNDVGLVGLGSYGVRSIFPCI